MSSNVDRANDLAIAKELNDRVIKIFTLVIDHNSTPDLTDVNRSYVFMVHELKQIYDRQPELKELGNAICWRVLDNLELAHELVPSIEFLHSGGDYGEGHNSSVSSLWILSGKEKPNLTPQLQKLITEADENIASFKSELDKMYATLTFESISVPVVTIGDEKFRFTSMRDGIAQNIISYCRAKHPNQQIDIKTLRSELEVAKISTNGINNLRDNIRNSVFGDKFPLKPFVTAFPKVILVRSTTALSDEQIEKIRVACR